MQIVGHLSAQGTTSQLARDFSSASACLNDWLRDKCGSQVPIGTIRKSIAYKKNTFLVNREAVEASLGKSESIVLTENLDDDRLFQTTLAITSANGQLSVSARLETARRGDLLAEVDSDPRCPSVYRDILNMPLEWTANETPISLAPLRFFGEDSGLELVDRICDPRRPIPIIVISQRDKFTFDPGLPDHLCRDLPSLTEVALVDPTASWALTQNLGHRWGCYEGAIRIYWPAFDMRNSIPERTCWTADMLHDINPQHAEAVNIFRARMRRAIFRRSAWRAGVFDEFDAIRLAAQQEKFKEYTAAVELTEDASKAMGDLWSQYEAAKEELRQKNAEIYNLKTQLEYAHEQLRGQDKQKREADADSRQLSTYDEAIHLASTRYPSLLVFGEDVPDYVREISGRTVDPDTVFSALENLAELAKALNDNPDIGMPHCQWLVDRGFRASGEKPMTVANQRNRQNRTFHDGRGKSLFLDHIKLRDNCPRNECVRIYFKYIPERKSTSIGLIGPHPE